MMRIYRHYTGIYLDYKKAITNFKNSYFNNEDWRIEETWFVFIRLTKQFIGFDNIYYDGHEVKSIVFCWLQLGKGYGYDSKPISQWNLTES